MAKKKIEPVFVSTRKIERRKLKRKLGNNKIKDAWRDKQVKKYGFRYLFFFLHKRSNAMLNRLQRRRKIMFQAARKQA